MSVTEPNPPATFYIYKCTSTKAHPMSHFDILGIRSRGVGGGGEGVKINIYRTIPSPRRTNERLGLGGGSDEWQRQFALYLAYPRIYINGFGLRTGRSRNRQRDDQPTNRPNDTTTERTFTRKSSALYKWKASPTAESP